MLVERGTELPFTGKLLLNKKNGTYMCVGCGSPLFYSSAKYDSGCGWPSFFEAVKESVDMKKDDSHGTSRIEVTCKKCGGHLGHVFDDGPQDKTGKRYCINSLALNFIPTSSADHSRY